LAEPDDLPPELWAPLRDLEKVIDHPTDDQLRCAGVGITDAFAGVARTGSVCVAMTGNLGGAVSLFPRNHVAVLDARYIVPRPGDVFTAGQLENKGLERSFVFITGPSVTADMGELVRGVHGPDHLHIIILEE
jgi:L-lactate dehydrogenase complex protein LldG